MSPLGNVSVLFCVGIVLCGCGKDDSSKNSSLSTGAETTATVGATPVGATTAGSTTIGSSPPGRETEQPGRAPNDSGPISHQPTSSAGPSAKDSGKISSSNLGAKASYYVVNDSGQISHRPASKKREE